MLLALSDHLRCTEPHADSWLVARADVAEDGRMVEGVLGCPICQTERLVASGVLYWTGVPRPSARPRSYEAHPDRVIRIGALIAFGDSSVPYVLCGIDANVAAGLGGLAETPLVLIDPPDDRDARLATIIRGAPSLPFSAGSIQGVAVDASHASTVFMDSCVGALVDGGRLVAPVASTLPAGIRELTRDAEQWVGQREVVGAAVLLRRAPKD